MAPLRMTVLCPTNAEITEWKSPQTPQTRADFFSGALREIEKSAHADFLYVDLRESPRASLFPVLRAPAATSARSPKIGNRNG